jgi:hypothetical protein
MSCPSKMGKHGNYANTFATEKALSQAERHAKRRLIAERMAIKIIQKLMTENPAHGNALAPPTYVDTPVRPLPPQPRTPEDLKHRILASVRRSTAPGKIIELDRNSQESKKLTPEMKADIHAAASGRVDG